MKSNNNIFILTGAKQTGKTTTLIQWSEGQNDVYGILTPEIDGKRFFMDACSKETFLMEAFPNEKTTVTIGKYIFSQKAFERADEILLTASTQTKGWIIIDEIGPLELKEEGFYLRAKQILKKVDSELQIILVIRESMLNEAILKLGIDNYTFFQKK